MLTTRDITDVSVFEIIIAALRVKRIAVYRQRKT